MPDYLLEIGTEELPADYVTEAQERLKTLFSDCLLQSNISFEEIVTMGTPRRLACIVKGLAEVQSTVKKKVKGPKVQNAFDSEGKPLPAALGFAQKQGVPVESLVRETTGGVEFLVADITVEGRPCAEVIQQIVPKVITGLSGERFMRWASFDLKFSRPIRWLVSLLDNQELPVALESLRSGRQSFGNRVLAPGAIEVESPGRYVQQLRSAKVLVDPVERRRVVEEQVIEAARQVAGQPRQLKASLLEEVVNILEWPHALIGEFAPEYLELPDALIETIMVHHQRYFPVEKENGGGSKLLPYFIAVANNDRPEAGNKIKQGNERVLKARLADGRFFYLDDQKTKLTRRKNALEQLTFQEGLGSYMVKCQRMLKAARLLADTLQLDAKHSVCLERTVELCKLDLVTNLVRELPELQGLVGSWYAALEGEPPEVVLAIATHYKPAAQGDEIPSDLTGRLTAVLDKLDNLTGLFALGRRPSGSSDPYALRRQAQGLVDILCDGLFEHVIDVAALIELLMGEVKPVLENRRGGFDSSKALSDLSDFLMLRIRLKLQEYGFKREVIEAVCSDNGVLRNVPDAVVRCRVLDELISGSGLDVIRIGVRIANILGPSSSSETVDVSALSTDFEKALWHAFSAKVVARPDGHGQPRTQEEYVLLVNQLRTIVPEVDSFFDNVLVNDPDEKIKKNRHALLWQIHRCFSPLGDFSKLQPLLP